MKKIISKIVTKDDIELHTFRKFLNNTEVVFDEKLIDDNKTEPTDIRYKGINYQITMGDKEYIQKTRKITSKGSIFTEIRGITNIFELLLKGALEKKSFRADINTILLIDATIKGKGNWYNLEKELSTWAKNNFSLCNCWKDIYLVYKEKNIKIKI